MRFLTRLALVSPLVYISAVKFVPAAWEALLADLMLVAPGSELPPDEMIQNIGIAEAFVAFFAAVGVAPKLFQSAAAVLYFTPVVLLKGDTAGITQFYAFMLALHVACAGALLADAWQAANLKRISVMQAFLPVAIIKYSTERLAEHMESFKALAPPGTEPPPDNVMGMLGYVELASILFVVGGVAPKLFNTFAAVQFSTPVFILGPKILEVRHYMLFGLLFHVACAAVLLDDAWPAPAAGASRKKKTN